MRPTDVVELFARIRLFAGLSSAQLGRLAELGSEESHAAGAVIFSEGERGDGLYLPLSGTVRLYRAGAGGKGEPLAILEPGAYFGELGLVDDAPRAARAVAQDACRLFVLRRQDFQDLLFVDRDLAYELLWSLLRVLSDRLRTAEARPALAPSR